VVRHPVNDSAASSFPEFELDPQVQTG
jgi:hypothetical protein